MADVKITGLTANTTLASGDLLVMVDDPGGTPLTQKITIDNFLKALNVLTALSNPDDSADELLIYDTSTSTAKKVTVLELLEAILTTNGDILFRNNSGIISRLAKGAAEYVLTMNAAATEPTWATPSAGLIETQVFS